MQNKTSYLTRFSYASSDMAGQLIFGVVSFYIFKFYTDVVGLSATVAGTIMLIARLEDAIDTPIWGILLDKTKSKLGKSRPWFLRLCIPFSIFGVLTFLSPDLSGNGKAIYAAVTYIILGSIYTGINTPVTSILSALSADPKERVTLTCYRMFGSKVGVLLMNATFLPLVGILGQGDDKKGYLLTMPIFALGSLALYLFAFRNLEEKIPSEQEPMPVKKAFKAFKGNWPWIIIFISCFFFWVAFIARITVVPHFFEYVWGNKGIIPLVNSLDFLSLGAIFMIPWFCKWARKGTIWAWGLGLSAVSQVVLYIGVSSNSMTLLMIGWIGGIMTSGVAMALPFSLLSDSVDFGEWKTGVRSAGLLTAIGTGFCLKAGSGLGGALPAWIMGATGYQANQVQTPEAISGIEIGFIWLPAVFYIVALMPVLFYRKYEEMEPQIQEALNERRSSAS
ncbi:MFS transporter [Puniceicoccaceae bacterium K14]|nr:MFS transporter [Puniceicoccaceae bacterium K14]